MLTSTYQGALCDCSVRGYFVGTVHLAGDMSIAATNTLNDSLTMKPVAAFNQLVLAVNSSDGYCSFAPNFAQGSLMGLPTEAPLRPSTKGVSPRNPGVSAHPHLHANPVSETQSWARELDFAGYDSSLSAAPALASAANASSARRRLMQAGTGALAWR
eukprot:1159846-Rhodomonas_salina.1